MQSLETVLNALGAFLGCSLWLVAIVGLSGACIWLTRGLFNMQDAAGAKHRLPSSKLVDHAYNQKAKGEYK